MLYLTLYARLPYLFSPAFNLAHISSNIFKKDILGTYMK